MTSLGLSGWIEGLEDLEDLEGFGAVLGLGVGGFGIFGLQFPKPGTRNPEPRTLNPRP